MVEEHMEYILTDLNSIGLDAYWFVNAPSLEDAFAIAADYPEANFVLEYRVVISPGRYPGRHKSPSLLPTGKSWSTKRVNDALQSGKQAGKE